MIKRKLIKVHNLCTSKLPGVANFGESLATRDLTSSPKYKPKFCQFVI